MSNTTKIGFWSLFSIVIASQIGSGIFMLPASLAPYGYYALVGWLVSAAGAIALSLVFASLAMWYPETGGPHVYVNKAFGSRAAFFTGWTYWVISWVSSTAVVIASIGYLTPFIGNQEPIVYCLLQVLLVVAVMALNLRGVKAAGGVEFFLTLIKVIPLFILPCIALLFFNKNNFQVDQSVEQFSALQLISRTVLLTLWAFIGLETGTAPAGSVDNPSKTIPLAVVSGTMFVAFINFFNSLAVMGLIPGSQLLLSKAPYVDVAQILFGTVGYFLISCLASIVCIGSLNSWVLTSSQVSLGLAEGRFFPPLFAHKNEHDAPVWGLVTSCLGIIPLLFLTMNKNFGQQITSIIDFSVTAFIFVYLACTLAFLKLLAQRTEKRTLVQLIYGLLSLVFCFTMLYNTPVMVLAIASLFVISGIPCYLYFSARSGKPTAS